MIFQEVMGGKYYLAMFYLCTAGQASLPVLGILSSYLEHSEGSIGKNPTYQNKIKIYLIKAVTNIKSKKENKCKG